MNLFLFTPILGLQAPKLVKYTSTQTSGWLFSANRTWTRPPTLPLARDLSCDRSRKARATLNFLHVVNISPLCASFIPLYCIGPTCIEIYCPLLSYSTIYLYLYTKRQNHFHDSKNHVREDEEASNESIVYINVMSRIYTLKSKSSLLHDEEVQMNYIYTTYCYIAEAAMKYEWINNVLYY